jgi:hypothetical protein
MQKVEMEVAHLRKLMDQCTTSRVPLKRHSLAHCAHSRDLGSHRSQHRACLTVRDHWER